MIKTTFRGLALLCIAALTQTSCNAASGSKSSVSEQTEEIVSTVEETKTTEADKIPAPDFTLNDINGKPLSLSSLRGKYVVLDFWGSWCIWCVRGFPKMKEYYQKYNGKFEILGIDCSEPESRWKDAVKKLELPWLHVYCPEGNDLLVRYAIEGFPTKILVDPEGNIAKVVVGEDPAFYTFLDEQFK